MTTVHDCIVVGSGCTGAMAAQTLLRHAAHVNVLMLDGGKRDDRYAGLIPEKNFTDIRHTEPEQYRYLLGDDFESIPAGDVSTGEQLTPPRRFLVDGVNEFLALHSETFFPMESLAYGGLGAGWGLGCCTFSQHELVRAGLPVSDMRDAYQVVADRIGISGCADDARRYTFGAIEGVQPASRVHPSAAQLLERYYRRRNGLNANGFYLGRPALALLTEDKGHRRASAEREMEFYDDRELSAWRAWITVDELKRDARFHYVGGVLVTSFSEEEGCVAVTVLDLETRETRTYRCRKLVLASGVLGTARIVLRALNSEQRQLPLLCNPYTYTPCVMPSQIGKSVPDGQNGMAQLSLFHDPYGTNSDVAMASLYTYRSLLLFRLLREVPLGVRDARNLMQYLQSGLVIAGIHHPESPGPQKHVRLERDGSSPTGDRLHATYVLSADDQRKIGRREKAFRSALRSLGAWALKRVRPGHGSSIHYGGTLPFDDGDRPFTLRTSGRLNGTRRVFVADGSGFCYLPAKGLTLSLMANAHRVASRALA